MAAPEPNAPAVDLHFQDRLFLIVFFAVGRALRTCRIVAITPVAKLNALFLENLKQRFHFSALESAF